MSVWRAVLLCVAAVVWGLSKEVHAVLQDCDDAGDAGGLLCLAALAVILACVSADTSGSFESCSLDEFSLTSLTILGSSTSNLFRSCADTLKFLREYTRCWQCGHGLSPTGVPWFTRDSHNPQHGRDSCRPLRRAREVEKGLLQRGPQKALCPMSQ